MSRDDFFRRDHFKNKRSNLMTQVPQESSATPYAATNDEWKVAFTQFSKFCVWLAQKACRILKVPRGNTDMAEDIRQELYIVLLRMIAKYKRQMYVVHCIEWFMAHPDMIPDAALHDVGFASFCWRFRSHLGANHGFHPYHDKILHEAMSGILAPVDFRWERPDECRRFMDSVSSDRLASLSASEMMVFERYRAATLAARWVRPEPEDQVAMNDMVPKLSALSIKPCRYRPFFLDQAFHPYVKRILLNWMNKYVSRHPRVDGVGYVNIDELSEAIPDARVSTTNPFMRRSDPRYRHQALDHEIYGHTWVSPDDVMEEVVESEEQALLVETV